MCSYTLISVKNSTLRARYCVLSFSHSPQFVLVKRIGGLPHATGANSIPFYVTSVFAYIASILYKLPSCYNTTANLFTREANVEKKKFSHLSFSFLHSPCFLSSSSPPSFLSLLADFLSFYYFSLSYCVLILSMLYICVTHGKRFSLKRTNGRREILLFLTCTYIGV